MCVTQKCSQTGCGEDDTGHLRERYTANPESRKVRNVTVGIINSPNGTQKLFARGLPLLSVCCNSCMIHIPYLIATPLISACPHHRKHFTLTARSRRRGPNAISVVIHPVIRSFRSLDLLPATVIQAIPPEEGETDSDERGERLQPLHAPHVPARSEEVKHADEREYAARADKCDCEQDQRSEIAMLLVWLLHPVLLSASRGVIKPTLAFAANRLLSRLSKSSVFPSLRTGMSSEDSSFDLSPPVSHCLFSTPAPS